jgi:hypothetical protein
VDTWGHGYATEVTHALAAWAFSQDVYEVFAVVRPGNTRASATVRNNGMQWVGETAKYFGVELQVFCLRVADLDAAAPASPSPPGRGWLSALRQAAEPVPAPGTGSSRTAARARASWLPQLRRASQGG